MYILLALLLCIILLIGLFLFIKYLELLAKKPLAEKKYKETEIQKIPNPGTIQSLRIIPLIDSRAISKDYKTENGVSMYLQTENKTILMDLGFNRKKEHPSPLVQNMQKLNLSFQSLDALFFSHAHLDHLGGMQEQKKKEFSLSQGFIETPNIPIYSPVNIKASKNNPQLNTIHITSTPQEIWPGISSIGSIPRQLYLMGYVEEQAFAFNIENKGIVLVIGCGHQTVERIIERTKKLFDQPIFAIFGGLHFPLLKKSPFSLMGLIQYIVGSDRPPWNGLSEKDLENAIQAIQNEKVQFVGLSPHDSSEYSIKRFKESFGEKYIEIAVGKEINL